MGIFDKRMNKYGAISGMIVGFGFTALYIIYFRFINPAADNASNWWFGISPEGVCTLGTLANLAVAYAVSHFTPEPPQEVQDIVEYIRLPGAAPDAVAH